MTAVGMTLGFGDAVALAESKDFNEFVKRRYRDIRAPEMIAMGLYELFVDHRAETRALRQAVYRIWRADGNGSEKSVRLLACEDATARSLALVGATVVALAIGRITPRSVDPRAWLRAGGSVYHLLSRIGWFVLATRRLSRSRSKGEVQNSRFHHDLSRAFWQTILTRSCTSSSRGGGGDEAHNVAGVEKSDGDDITRVGDIATQDDSVDARLDEGSSAARPGISLRAHLPGCARQGSVITLVVLQQLEHDKIT